MAKSPNRRTSTRPVRLKSLPAFPKGPKQFQVTQEQERPITDWSTPPAGFLTPWNSVVEWTVYKGCWKVLHCPGDAEDSDFTGYPGIFTYQSPFSGGRQIRGGAVIDFLIDQNPFDTAMVAIRLQTERFHLSSFGGAKAMYDLLQAQRISAAYDVRDLYETSFINDPTGAAVCRALIGVLSGRTQPNPTAGGVTAVVRRRPS